MRLFLAFDIDPAVRDATARVLDRLRPAAPKAKWVTAASLHVTLVFLGEVDPSRRALITEAMEVAARRCVPFLIRVRGGGAFGDPRRPRVLWAGVEGGDALVRAQQRLAGELVARGFAKEERPYHPHLTLARGRESGDRDLASCAASLASFDAGACLVGEMILYRSELSPGGPLYVPEASAPFGVPG